MGLSQEYKAGSTFENQPYQQIITHHINTQKKKNYVIISVDTEKALKKNSTCIHNENFQETRTRKNFLNMIKDIHKNPTTNIIVNDEKQKFFP